MDDAGDTENWEYKGGTFTSTASWRECGGRKLTELDNNTVRLEFLKKENKLILSSGNIASSNDPNLFLYYYKIISNNTEDLSLVLSNIIKGINVSYGGFTTYAVYNNDNPGSGSLIAKGDNISNGKEYNANNIILPIDKTARTICIAGLENIPNVALFKYNEIGALKGVSQKYTDNRINAEITKEAVRGFRLKCSYNNGLPNNFTFDSIILPSRSIGGEIVSLGNIILKTVSYKNNITVTIGDTINETIVIPTYLLYYRLTLTYLSESRLLTVYVNSEKTTEIDASGEDISLSNITLFNSEQYSYIIGFRLYSEALSYNEVISEYLFNSSVKPTVLWVTALDVVNDSILDGIFEKIGNVTASFSDVNFSRNLYTLFDRFSYVPEFTQNDEKFLRITSDKIPIAGFEKIYLDSKLSYPSTQTNKKITFFLKDNSKVEYDDDLTPKWIDVPNGAISLVVSVSYNDGVVLGEASSLRDFNEMIKKSYIIINKTINYGYKSCLVLGDSWSDSTGGLKPWVSVLASILNIDNTNICCVAKAGRKCKSVQGSQYTGYPITGGQTGYVAVDGTENCDLQNQVLLVKRLFEGNKQDTESIIFNEDFTPDVCIIAIGTNDTVDEDNSYEFIEQQIMTDQSTSVGYVPKALDNVDCTNFAGAIYFAAQTLYNLFPNTLVVYCLPPQTNLSNKAQQDKGIQIQRVCKRLGVPTINWYSGCGFTTLTCPITEKDGRYVVGSGGDMSSDGLHPSTKGYYKLGNW